MPESWDGVVALVVSALLCGSLLAILAAAVRSE